MKQNLSIKLLTSISLGALILTSGGVQTSIAAEEKVTLEEITVTARRRDESLQSVPIAVTAFSAADLDRRGISDITELAQSAPSVTLEASRATNSTLTAFIRGVGQQDPLAGFEGGVAIYLDDVYLARPQGTLLEVYDVERIEILRGPQGTLYGRNAVGGAIKYVTKRLSDEPSVSVRGSFGTYSQIDGVVSASVPLSDTLRIGGAIASLNRNGFGENITTGVDNYDKKILAFRGSLEFEPSEDVFIRISGDYSDDDSNPRYGHRPYVGAYGSDPVLSDVYDTTAGAATNASTAGIDGNNEVKAKGIHGLLEWSLNENVILKSITAYREDYTESVIDFDGLAVDDMDAAVIYDNQQFSQEFQLSYSSEKLNGLIGFYYLDASASNDFDVVLGQLGRVYYATELTAYTGGVVDTKAWSVFGEFSYDFTEDLSLTLGGRYTNDKRSADVLRQTFLGAPSTFFGNNSALAIATTSNFDNSRTFKKFTPRVVLDYRINDDVTTYASFSKGFKAGSFDPRGASVNGSHPDVENGFAPENLTTYEVGLKSTFAEGRARVNIAAFYSDYADMQIPGSLPIDTDNDGINDGFVGTVTNAGKATIKGVEMEGTLLISDGLVIQGNVSILDAKIDQWLLNGVNVAADRAVQNTPEFMSFLGATYTVPLAEGEISFSGSWSHKGSVVQFETPVSEIDQDAYSLFDASIVWVSDDNTWSVGLHGKNLSDTRYKTAGYNFPTLGLENNITVFYGAPRTVTVTAGYKF
ncbi:MAG: TonB-dependent receptor [Emcibacter sp.]|nr:TonB-dependent receptor [Emcibacter sp.]